MNMNALPFIYQYGIGATVMAVGLGAAWRYGYVGWEAGSRRRNLLLMLGGLVFFMGLQGYLQFIAPLAPHKTGGFEPVTPKSVGTPLDYGVIVAYFLAILGVGSYFGRHNKSTTDFFFGGQKFAWWFITMSLVATTVGSYSFVKYSRVAYTYGLSSSQTYLNDWFWLPLFLFGWLPIIFFSKVVSIPEYFERRFNKSVRLAMTVLLLIYLVGYIGINLYTMGVALHHLVGWDIFWAAVVVAAVSAVYVTWGGQTSVIVTDLMQGFVLLLAGGLILFLGISTLGGMDEFWAFLKPEHRQAFPNFNKDPSYSMVGVFWQDAMANSAVFLFLNQGIMMRFMSVRSINEGKKAAVATLVLLMPIAAMVVASGGWIGAAMDSAGLIPTDPELRPTASQIFFWVAAVLCKPGIFGLVMAALTAALMSTVDTLITAVAAIWVNDIWRPYVRPAQVDAYYLGIARKTSISVTLIGVGLVPVFMTFGSIYSAHAAFTAAITPPMVVTFLLAMLWPRFTPAAAMATLLGGSALVLLSIFIPDLIAPFSHGIPRVKPDGEVLEYAKAFKFTRALFGLSVSAVIGVVVTCFTRPRPVEELSGYIMGTVTPDGGTLASVFVESPKILSTVVRSDEDSYDEMSGRYEVRLSDPALQVLGAKGGDHVLLSDKRWWFGGLRSVHGTISDELLPGEGNEVEVGPRLRSILARAYSQVVVEKLP
jgi:SSS family solute:Na+ symporter